MSLRIAIPAAAWSLMGLGPLLSFVGLLPGIVGLGLLTLGGATGLFGSVGLALLAKVRKEPVPWSHVGAASVAGLLLVAMVAAQPAVPPIHDITTDLDAPPAITTAGRPELDGADLAFPADTRSAHAGHYTDLQPQRFPQPPAAVLDAAAAIARDAGWAIHRRDDGALELSDTTRIFRFTDDLVVRASRQGDATVVDVRSRSRVGQSDLGVNARRIRTLQAGLAAKLGS